MLRPRIPADTVIFLGHMGQTMVSTRSNPSPVLTSFSAWPSRNTLANANATRDWRIYVDFAQSLIGIARRLYSDDAFGVDLQNTVYALDSTTIDLRLSVFP